MDNAFSIKRYINPVKMHIFASIYTLTHITKRRPSLAIFKKIGRRRVGVATPNCIGACVICVDHLLLLFYVYIVVIF